MGACARRVSVPRVCTYMPVYLERGNDVVILTSDIRVIGW